MRAIITRWRMIKLLKTISFCAISLEINQWNLHCFTPVLGRKHDMMTSSKGNIFRVTGPLCGEFTGPGKFPAQRPVTRSFDVFFDLRPNKRLSKQPWGWWFETLSWSLWRHRNGLSPMPAECLVPVHTDAVRYHTVPGFKDSRVLLTANRPQARTSVFHIWYHFTNMADSWYRMFYIL